VGFHPGPSATGTGGKRARTMAAHRPEACSGAAEREVRVVFVQRAIRPCQIPLIEFAWWVSTSPSATLLHTERWANGEQLHVRSWHLVAYISKYPLANTLHLPIEPKSESHEKAHGIGRRPQHTAVSESQRNSLLKDIRDDGNLIARAIASLIPLELQGRSEDQRHRGGASHGGSREPIESAHGPLRAWRWERRAAPRRSCSSRWSPAPQATPPSQRMPAPVLSSHAGASPGSPR
jgi:hypothetical protein